MTKINQKINNSYKLVSNYFKNKFLIPKNWDYLKYRDVLKEISEPIEFNDDEKYELITIKRRNLGIISRGIFNGYEIKTKKLFRVDVDDFIIARMQIIHGACGLIPESLKNAKISSSYLRFKTRENLMPKYLNWFSHTQLFYQQTFVSSVGSNLEKMNFNKNHWLNHSIPLPPLDEQRKIVSILEKTKEMITNTQEIIDHLSLVKIAIREQLIHKGYNNKEFKEAKLGFGIIEKIPEHWNVIALSELLKSSQYGISSELSQKAKYPIFRMNNITDGNISTDDLKYVDLDENTFKKFRLQKNDLLFNRTNSFELVGKTGLFLSDGDYVFASYLIRLRTNEKILPKFLNYYLNSLSFLHRVRSMATRSIGQANVNAVNLKKLKIVLPSINEQENIIKILDSIEREIQTKNSLKRAYQDLQVGISQKLLSGEMLI